MERILPFKALRYNKNVVGDLGAVMAPPYDVISEQQQIKLHNSHPFNAIRLEYGLVNETDNETDNRYTRSAETLSEWTHSGVIVPDRQPAIYVYSHEFDLGDGQMQSCKGVVCLVRLDEFEMGTVLPHEETHPKAKNDRLKLMMECGVNFSPIYSLYLDEEKRIDGILQDVTAEPPDVSAKTSDGVVQKLWPVTDSEIIENITAVLADKQFFIADGHHRYETALNYRNWMREHNPEHTGSEPYNYVMMFLADMQQSGLCIFPTHRMVRNVVGYSEAGVISQLEQGFNISKIYSEDMESEIERKLAENKDIPTFAMYTGKEYYYLLRLKDYSFADEVNAEKSIALRHLDVTVLHSLVLGKAFGMTEAELKKQDFLSFTREIPVALERVKNGDFQCAFMLNPTKIHEIRDVSLVNEKMPQKSTWIYPKIKTGLIMNKIN